MTDPVRWLGALVVIAAVALLLLGEREDVSPGGLERMLVYDLAEPVRFKLEAGEREARLLTWLAAPPDEAVDVRRSEVYALALRVDDPDGTALLERTVWVPTHRSWRSLEDRVPPQRAPEGDLAPWDDRTTRIDLDGLVPEGGTLTVSVASAPAASTVLGVAFRLTESPPLVVLQRLRERTLDREDPLAPWPASSLPAAWQANAAGRGWERLGALPPEEGGLPPTVRIETWFDRLPAADAPATGVPLEPGAALAWLVQGPVRFEAEVLDTRGRPVADPLEVRVRAIDAPPSSEPRPEEAVRFVDGGRVELEVAGPVEIVLALTPSAAGPRVVRATTIGGKGDRALGDPPRLPFDVGRELVAPDLRELQAWRLAPGVPLAFDPAGKQLRITVRAALGRGERDPFVPREVGPPLLATLRTFDGNGAPSGEWTFAVPAVPSPFERYLRGDAATSRVGEPVTRYLVPPEGTARVTVATDRAADATVEASADPDEPWVRAPDYELPPTSAYALANEPFVERPWAAVAPVEHEALTRAARSVAIDAQVRLEIPGEDAPGADRRSLTLRGPFELLAEPDVDEAGEGARVRLGRAPARVWLPPSGRLLVEHRVSPARVGEEVVLTVGDRVVRRPIVAAGGTLRVDDAGDGPVAVAVEADGLFLARGRGAPAWQVRRVWPVADGGELLVPIPPGAGSLSVVAYRVGDAGHVRWHVEEHGAASGSLSEHAVPARGDTRARWTARDDALPLSYDGPRLAPLAPIVVHRPEGAPDAVLVLRPEGTGRIFVRAAATWGEAPADEPRHARQGASP